MDKQQTNVMKLGLLGVAVMVFAFVPIGNATLLTYLGNMLTGLFTVSSPIMNTWVNASFTGFNSSSVTGNAATGNFTAGNPLVMAGTIDNNAPASSRNITFLFTSQYANLTANSLTSADIPTTSLLVDGASTTMPCVVSGSDYNCSATGVILSSGHHTFALGYTTSAYFDTTANLAVSMKVQ